jgi:hypothetical protein
MKNEKILPLTDNEKQALAKTHKALDIIMAELEQAYEAPINGNSSVKPLESYITDYSISYYRGDKSWVSVELNNGYDGSLHYFIDKGKIAWIYYSYKVNDSTYNISLKISHIKITKYIYSLVKENLR